VAENGSILGKRKRDPYLEGDMRELAEEVNAPASKKKYEE